MVFEPAALRNKLTERNRTFREQRDLEPWVRIWDGDYNPAPGTLGGTLTRVISGHFEEQVNDTGEGEVIIPGDHPLSKWIIEQDTYADIHITVDTPGHRWAGKVETVTVHKAPDGSRSIILSCKDDYEHIKHILAWVNPFFPAEIQIGPGLKNWVIAGPTKTCIQTTLFVNLLRLYFPLWNIGDAFFDPQEWLANLNPNNWPIIPMPMNNFRDTTKWTILSSRFKDCHSLFAQSLHDGGLRLKTIRWLPGDPQPAPSHMTLKQSTMLVDVEDNSGVKGPTGTFLDGILTFIVGLADDGLTEVFLPTDSTEVPEYSLAKWLGTDPKRPWIVYRDGEFTGIDDSEMNIHKSTGWLTVTGGHSPEIINQLIAIAITTLLTYIGFALGILGLDNLYQGQFDDTILAFQTLPDLGRKRRMGRHHYNENFESGNGTAYTLPALATLLEGRWKSRAYMSFKISVLDGAPYLFGKHMQLGSRVGAEIQGRIYVDNLTAAVLDWDRNTPPTWTLSIGDDKAEESGIAAIMRHVSNTIAIVKDLNVF